MAILEEEKITLIIGADGTIGREIYNFYRRIGKPFLQTTRHYSKIGDQCLFLDLSIDASFKSIPLNRISEAIICAGITSSARCQAQTEITRTINVLNTVALIKYLIDAGIFVIFFSTTTVFDGLTEFAKLTDPVCPQTEYARQKVEVEKELLKLGDKTIILRIGKVITPYISLFKDWIHNLEKGKVIHPFYDAVMAPVSSEFLIQVIQKIMQKKVSGIIHVTAKEDISYADTAFYIAKELRFNVNLIHPISCKEASNNFFPKYAALDGTDLNNLELESPDPKEVIKGFCERYIRMNTRVQDKD